MKKFFSFLFVLMISSVFISDSFAQSFFTGGIGITQSNGGRTRVFSDNLTTRQIDRVSVLVGVSSSAVFDYSQDQGALVNAATVTSPLLSNFEVTSTINNSYANLPPNVEVAFNIYGWTNGAYLLVKMAVKNNEASAINAVIGLETIPQVDGAYGNETVQYDIPSKTTLMNKTGWVGLKFMSVAQTALKTINWVSGYGNDQFFYTALTQNSYDPAFTAGADGAVAILGSSPVTINAGQSVEFYYGISYGTSQANCLSAMAECQQKYFTIVPVELTSFTAKLNGNKVSLDWVTASELNNWGFEIQRRSNDNPDWITVGYREGVGTTSENQNYSFVDNISGVTSEKLYYRLKQVDFGGAATYYDEIEVVNAFAPDQFTLDQNFPNPFNPSTRISFGLPERSNITLKVFNLMGEEVAVLANGLYESGTYSIDFNAIGLVSGVYIYSLQTESNLLSGKMTLMK